MYVSSKQDDWDESIDFVTFGYNTSRHESTGVTPFFMLYGREAILPIDVALGNNPNPFNNVPTAADLVRRLTTIREIVRKRMLVVQARQKRRYDSKRTQRQYKVGDVVLVYRPIRQKGRATKLLHRYHGPFRISCRVNSLNYHVEYLSCAKRHTKKKRTCVHVSMLKPFHFRDA